MNPMPVTNSSPATTHGSVASGAASMPAVVSTERNSSLERPSTRTIHPAVQPPTTEPSAKEVRKIPYPLSDRPIGPGSTAYSGSNPNTAEVQRFITPTIKAMVRRSRWPSRYRTPSAMSVRRRTGTSPSRDGRNEPLIRRSAMKARA